MGKLMLKANVVKKPVLERVGLNSLRDFFLDGWAGLVVGTDEEAEKHLSDFIETNNEEKILNRLDKGKVFYFLLQMVNLIERLRLNLVKMLVMSLKLTPLIIVFH